MNDRHRVVRRAALLCAVALPLAARGVDLGGLLGKRGSGHVVHDESNPGEFDAIHIGGALNVVVRQGREPRVVVDIDDNLLPLLDVSVSDGTLVLKPRAKLAPTKLAVVVDAWILERLTVDGSAAVTVETFVSKHLEIGVSGSAAFAADDLTAEDLRVRASGSAAVQLAGRANELQAAVSGSAVLGGAGFKVRRAQVSVSGSGVANVWATETLAGSVAARGVLSYRGEPRLEVAKQGKGILRRDS